MAQNLYITAMEPESGKSIASLGVLELLSGRVERLGFFRPVVPSHPDPQLELARDRYGLEAAHGLTHDEAISDKPYEVLRKDVVAAYKPFEANCDFVVCEGTDFVGAVPALDFGLNADLANELGAPVLVVVKGASSPEETLSRVGAAQGALRHKGCTVFGVLVNRVPPEHADGIGAAAAEAFPGDPIYVLSEHPELSYATVAEAAEALGAEVLVDPRATLGREVRDVRVGAMSVEHFFDHLVEGALVLVPSDRPEVLLACLASSASQSVPTVAGVVLTGGYPLAESIGRLLEDAPFPVLQTPQQTHEATAALQTIRPLVRAGDDRKIAAALGLFESAVDTAELERRIAVERPERITPIMFEYELIERARADKRHIVLPEGDDDRVLRAAELLMRRGVVDLTVLGEPEDVRARAAGLGVDLDGVNIVDPLTSPLRDGFASRYFVLRKHKGVTEELAHDVAGDASYFGTLMVDAGEADGMVSGAAHTTGDTIRPAFEIIKARKGVSVVSSVFLMCLADRVLVYGDCAVNPKPDAGQLADIAISSAETAAGLRDRAADRDALVLDGHVREGRGRRPRARGDRGGARAASRPRRRGADPVRRRDRPRRGGAEAPGQRRRRPGDGVRLPGPRVRKCRL